MKKQNSRISKKFLAKSSYINKENQLNQINLDKLKSNERSSSIKNERPDKFNYRISKKIYSSKNIQLSPSCPTYKTETFNSYNQIKSNCNIIDVISEKGNIKKLAMSKEKKIYLYLKNNLKNNNSEANSIIETPKTLFKKPEEIIDKLSLDEENKEEIEKNFNKTSIINNINNNNVNNIFVNFISSNVQNDLSRNLGRAKMDNSLDNNIQNNSLTEEDGTNKTSAIPKNPGNSKIFLFKNEKSQKKQNINSSLNKENKKKEDKLDYFTKIMYTANSFIFNRNNKAFYKMKEQKTDPRLHKKSKNKNNKHGEKNKKSNKKNKKC